MSTSTSSQMGSVVLTVFYGIRPHPSHDGNHTLQGPVMSFTTDNTLSSRLTADEHETYKGSFPREYRQARDLGTCIQENLQSSVLEVEDAFEAENASETDDAYNAGTTNDIDDTNEVKGAAGGVDMASTTTPLTPEWIDSLVETELKTAWSVAQNRRTTFGSMKAVRLAPEELEVLEGQAKAEEGLRDFQSSLYLDGIARTRFCC
ncbi:hypothetical protein EHS25_006318 [Saitozyma podzolica]|uniref:Uncharacterized protein n=1 Tax=Saitozyma podzolica TaxID=1890683 RepID=A0A427YRG6_9TREE|nr:hypothetical protein EHS25_006318 [Saitozyma podzolica]